MFNGFLYVNILAYIVCFLIIIIFALVVLVGFIRGDTEFVNPRKGLSMEEIGKL